MNLESTAVTSTAPDGESYRDFQKRVSEDSVRVKGKIASLDPHTACCWSCGETVGPEKAGQRCRVNNASMASRWAREKAKVEFYRLGHFARGAWVNEVDQLACLLDRVWADARSSS